MPIRPQRFVIDEAVLEAVLKLIMASIGEASGVSLLAESSFHSSE